jgi:hypothetical protein
MWTIWPESNNIITFLKKLVLMGSGFLSTFRGYIGFTKLFFHVDMKNSAFKIMVKPKDENLVTKLWC